MRALRPELTAAAAHLDRRIQNIDGVYEQFPEQFHDVADALRIRRIPPGDKARLGDLLDDAD